LEEICLNLAGAVSISSREHLRTFLHDGSAWRKFQEIVEAQGGDVSKLEKLAQVHRAPVIREVRAEASGVLRRMDAYQTGLAVLNLGAGRSKASDPVDFAVGCDQIAKTGTQVQIGQVLARIHARREPAAEAAERTLREGITIE
jgi:thymidine phosphorylase